MFNYLKKCKKGSYFFYGNPYIHGVTIRSEGGENLLLRKLNYDRGLKRYRCGIVTAIFPGGTISIAGEMYIHGDQIVFPAEL
jgi:hypothetical protein